MKPTFFFSLLCSVIGSYWIWTNHRAKKMSILLWSDYSFYVLEIMEMHPSSTRACRAYLHGYLHTHQHMDLFITTHDTPTHRYFFNCTHNILLHSVPYSRLFVMEILPCCTAWQHRWLQRSASWFLQVAVYQY